MISIFKISKLNKEIDELNASIRICNHILTTYKYDGHLISTIDHVGLFSDLNTYRVIVFAIGSMVSEYLEILKDKGYIQ